MTLSFGHVEPVPPMVSSWTDGWGIMSEGVSATAPVSTAYSLANEANYFPLYVPVTCVAKRMWWANGSTVSGTYNVEVGIYLDAGHKPGAKLITTGSVAQGTASNVQFADITDTTLTPGVYWLYISCSTTSATFLRSTATNASWMYLTKFQESSVGPGSAPATATPAEASTSQDILLFGFSTTTIT